MILLVANIYPVLRLCYDFAGTAQSTASSHPQEGGRKPSYSLANRTSTVAKALRSSPSPCQLVATGDPDPSFEDDLR